MTIMEALEQNRASATVFAGYGKTAYATHAVDVDELVNKLNETCK